MLMGTSSVTPTATVALVLGVVFAIIGWQSAVNFKRRHGVTQWGARPALWSLIFFFSFVIGGIVQSVARRSTERDLEEHKSLRALDVNRPAEPPGSLRIVAAALLFVLGVGAIVGSVMGLGSVSNSDLAALTTASPDSGLIATSIGSTGPRPTTLLHDPRVTVGLLGTKIIPASPVIYLKPVSYTVFGVNRPPLASYWKVFWDGATQTQVDVSLQQHLRPDDATSGLNHLVSQVLRPVNFDTKQVTFSYVGSFTIPGIADSTGYQWSGLIIKRVPLQYRFVIFSRGSTVALVGLTSFRGAINTGELQQFALAEYQQMSTSSTLPVSLSGVLLSAGLALMVAGVIAIIGHTYLRRLTPAATPAVTTLSGAWGDPLSMTATESAESLVATDAASAPPTSPDIATITTVPPPIYCSWCRATKEPGDNSIHYCGDRTREPLFCSGCGEPLKGLAAFCATCGASTSRLSPP